MILNKTVNLSFRLKSERESAYGVTTIFNAFTIFNQDTFTKRESLRIIEFYQSGPRSVYIYISESVKKQESYQNDITVDPFFK